MNGKGIFRIDDLIGMEDLRTLDAGGRFCRAVPEPFYYGLLGRLSGALSVLMGSAYPIEWPEAGDLERALLRGRREGYRDPPPRSVRGARP